MQMCFYPAFSIRNLQAFAMAREPLKPKAFIVITLLDLLAGILIEPFYGGLVLAITTQRVCSFVTGWGLGLKDSSAPKSLPSHK